MNGETIVNFINWTRMLSVGVGGYVQNPNITFVLNIISNKVYSSPYTKLNLLLIFECFVQIRAHTWSIFEWFLQIIS